MTHTASNRAASYQEFEANLDTFYDRLREIRGRSPQQTLDQLSNLLLGEDLADEALVACWQRLVENPHFAAQSINFFNRCCYSLINYWTTQPGGKHARVELVHLFHQLLQEESDESMPWFCLLEQFGESPQFSTLEELIKVDVPQSGLGDSAQKPLSELVHHYPFLYPSYFTRYNSGEEGHRSILLLKEQQEQQFDRRLLKYTRQLGRASQQGQPAQSFDNPTLLSNQELATAINEFAGLSPNGHCYQKASAECSSRMARLASYRSMKGEIHSYLLDGLESYGQQRQGDHIHCAGHHVGNWLGAQLQGFQVEFDDRRPHNPQSLIYTCGGLLNVILADPTTPNGLRNHVRFIDMISNLGETFTIGVILKLLMLCRNYKKSVRALDSAVAGRFVRLFEHYESRSGETMDTDLSWLVKCLDNYMVASTIHFSDTTPPSMWNQLLRT